MRLELLVVSYLFISASRIPVLLIQQQPVQVRFRLARCRCLAVQQVCYRRIQDTARLQVGACILPAKPTTIKKATQE